MREISEWVGGDYVWPEKGAPYVHVSCGAKKENCRAYIGDWVTSLVGNEKPNFRVYKQHTFLQTFRKILSEAEKFAKVHELLMKIRSAQDVATYYGETTEDVVLLVEKTAHEICGLFQQPE
jgi:hypothetical protein